MGYAKFRLDRCGDYQRAFATLRVAKMLLAYAEHADGPMELGCEVPVDEWDDVLEIARMNGQWTATHYQLKRQYKDFGSDGRKMFEKLFASAARILNETDTYAPRKIPPALRGFVLVLPPGSPDVAKGLSTDALRSLLKAANGNGAGAALVTNRGSKLSVEGQAWLDFVRKSVSDDGLAAQVLERTTVVSQDEQGLEERTTECLARLFDDHDRAAMTISWFVDKVQPEGRLRAETMLQTLALAKPRSIQRAVRLGLHGTESYASGLFGRIPADLSDLAAEVVDLAWRTTGPVELQVHMSPKALDASPPLQHACKRLLLHAGYRPTRAVSHAEWWERCKADVQGSVGCDLTNEWLELKSYENQDECLTLTPERRWHPDALGAALHAAMDNRVWADVERRVAEELSSNNELCMAYAAVYRQIRALGDPFERLLKGWWAREAGASGVARAGPLAARRIASIMVAVAILRWLGCRVEAPGQAPDIARCGLLPVRGLAISHASVMNGNRWAAEPLLEQAREVMGAPGIVILHEGDPEAFDGSIPLDRTGPSANVQALADSAWLLTPQRLIAWLRLGIDEARVRMRADCRRRAMHREADFAAAIECMKEMSVDAA
jgi:hypothetical protein